MKIHYILSLIFFLSQNAFSSPPVNWHLNLNSALSMEYFTQPFIMGAQDFLTRLEISPLYYLRLQESWRFSFKPVLISSPDNPSQEEKLFYDLGDTYLRYKRDSWALQMGTVLVSWGVTDGFNPLDVINPRQYYDPLNSRKLSSPGIVWSQSIDGWEYEVIYIPQTQESLLPGPNSRWLPREIYIPQTQANDVVLLLPNHFQYKYSGRQNLDKALENNGAFRLQRHGDTFDISLSAYEGAALFPLVKPQVTGEIVQVFPKTVIRVDSDVSLLVQDYRIRQSGFSMIYNHPQFLLKWVTSYSQSLGEDPLLPGWTHENVAALEKTFGPSPEALLIAVLQYSWIESQRANDSNLSSTEIFRKAWMLGGKLQWREIWNFSFLGLFDSLRGSHLEEIEIGRKFLDLWSVHFKAQFIDGPSETTLGVFKKNDSFKISISRSF